MNLKLEDVGSQRSFLFLWCGSCEGLDLGREVRLSVLCTCILSGLVQFINSVVMSCSVEVSTNWASCCRAKDPRRFVWTTAKAAGVCTATLSTYSIYNMCTCHVQYQTIVFLKLHPRLIDLQSGLMHMDPVHICTRYNQ